MIITVAIVAIWSAIGYDAEGFSADTAPLEYPCYGNGDLRSNAFNIKDEHGVYGVDLRYDSWRKIDGKYQISGLPAVHQGETDAYTVEIILKDVSKQVEVCLRYGVLPELDGSKIIDIAKQASELGVEMLVLDDGWFGKRDSDNSGLGDWVVNEKKLGCTLWELVEKINSMGMEFGLWIEPEMVNEDSELYRQHKDWAYIIPGRKPVLGRNQLVLDFSRKEVVDYIFDQHLQTIRQDA